MRRARSARIALVRRRLMRDLRIIDWLARASPTDDLPRSPAQRARRCAHQIDDDRHRLMRYRRG
jgi:hypothetical protein